MTPAFWVQHKGRMGLRQQPAWSPALWMTQWLLCWSRSEPATHPLRQLPCNSGSVQLVTSRYATAFGPGHEARGLEPFTCKVVQHVQSTAA